MRPLPSSLWLFLLFTTAAGASDPLSSPHEAPIAAGQTCSATVYDTGRMAAGIAQDETHLYYAADGELLRVNKSGGSPERIAGESLNVGGIAVDETHVYYSALQLNANETLFIPGSGVIRSVPKSGGTAWTLASGLNGPGEVRVDATHVYWNNLGTQQSSGFFNPDASMARIAKSGGAVETLVSGIYGVGPVFDMDDQFLYYGENGGAVGFATSGPRGIRRIPKTGGRRFPSATNNPVTPSICTATGSSSPSASGSPSGWTPCTAFRRAAGR